jgi:hypothetical protein
MARRRTRCGRLEAVTALWPDDYARTLVEEACRKSGLLWLTPTGSARAQAAWHAWLDGAAYVVTDGVEQPLPGVTSGLPVKVTVRSKDTGGRLVTWIAVPEDVAPGSEEWDTAVKALAAKRLNAPDGEQQPQRWARESRVLRLAPTGEVVELPGSLPAGSGAAAPPASPATTRPALPFVVGPRARRHRRH